MGYGSPLAMDVLLAQTSPRHNLSKSDLESTLNLSALTSDQRAAVHLPLPELTVGNAITSLLNPLPGSFLLSSKPLIQHSTNSLKQYFRQEALAACLNHAGGRRLINDFFSNTVAKKEIVYDVGSTVSSLVATHLRFVLIATTFDLEFKKRYHRLLALRRGSVNVLDLASEFAAAGATLPAPQMPFFGIGDPLGILGSFQEVDVRLVQWEQDTSGFGYRATLQYELFDHFGCDNSDLTGLPTHGTPGQIAMWLLARDPRHAPGNKPFVVKIIVQRTVEGTVTV